MKPRFGSASVGFELVYDHVELERAFLRSKAAQEGTPFAELAIPGISDVVIQQLLPGSEFGLDVASNLDGAYVTHTLKKARNASRRVRERHDCRREDGR